MRTLKFALFLLALSIALPLFTSKVYAANSHEAVCPVGGKGNFRCHAQVVIDEKGQPKVTIAPSGYGPKQFRGAYSLSGVAPSTQTIAIVDAYDQPFIFSDLSNYSKQFGISGIASCPVSTGTATSPCFQKVDENGGTFYPGVNSGWSLETSLDVEVSHAVCQNCNLLLVEAYSASYADLMTAVNTARLLGAKVISNSYGSGEFSGENFYDSYFNHPGVTFTFSSGDNGYGTGYPAASSYVTSVGGTSLYVDSSNNYLSESTWNGTGSGCSLYESKPVWQQDILCSNRTMNDVSADADPATGAAVYDSVRYQGHRGWFQVGGTSLASPIIAATYAQSANPGAGNSFPYSESSFLHDVTTGSNGICSSYLCQAGVGYDGPTGLGTPKGTSAF